MPDKTTGFRFFFVLFLALARSVSGQTPFDRTGQVFTILQANNSLEQFQVIPGYNTLGLDPIGALPAGGLDAIGFRKTDNLVYGINPGNNHLYRIGKAGTVQDLGPVGLDNALFYLAGDVSPDGTYLLSVGSNAGGSDVHLAKTDLTGGAYSTQFTPVAYNGQLVDLAFDPFAGKIYGYDAKNGQVIVLNEPTGSITAFPPMADGNKLFGLYFDAFGDLYGYGNTLYGIVDALFFIDKNTGKETRLATGSAETVKDAASCPFSIEIKNRVEPEITLPCSPVTFTYTFANGSGQTLSNIDFEHPLPPGFHYSGTVQNPFGVPVDTLSVPGSIRLKGISLPPGTRQLALKVDVTDISKGPYRSQASLRQLPPLYGLSSLSDNPSAPGFEDSTVIAVNRFDADSLFFRWFICHGKTLVLDATEYGGSVKWNTGSTTPQLEVSKGGKFSLEAGSSCESIVVNHDVTSASCPYTISVKHQFLPDTAFGCSEVILRFILENDSGEPRFNLSFTDTLPPSFLFLEILKNPFGGVLQPNLPPGIVSIDGMLLPIGKDTLELLVQTGDVLPGTIRNRAKLYNLPIVMGPNRLSDDPRTHPADSSTLYIIGAFSDSLFFDTVVCRKSSTTLDGSIYGKTFLWEDGTTLPQRTVTEPGNYQLTVLDGCKPAVLTWTVMPGKTIYAHLKDSLSIYQGESILFEPLIFNQGDTLVFNWTDPPGNSLSCLNCYDPVARPLHSTVYALETFNGVCADTAYATVFVDETRRLYAPNIFSPNGDGQNDYFFLQSPDFGVLRRFAVFDRWGNLLFQTTDSAFDETAARWDGRSRGKDMPEGVYLWLAEIEYVDGTRQRVSGDIALVRR